MQLEEFGWNQFFSEEFDPYRLRGFSPGRVCRCHRESFLVWTPRGEVDTEATGRLRYTSDSADDWPVVGDWVALSPGYPLIDAVLPRRTKFSRKQPGAATEEQILAANVDIVFVVTDAGSDFNLPRIERYLLMVSQSGAKAIVVINKADLVDDPSSWAGRAAQISGGQPVLAVSARTGEGLDGLRHQISSGKTAALAGSSGVGKSTIVNHLLGYERLPTGSVRESDGRGRHTTTHREIIPIPGAGLLMDLPGLRELQVWGGAEAADEAFSDIGALAADCRFRDCSHGSEAGCAVLAAVADGRLDHRRYESYLKLQKELAYHETKVDERAALERKREEKRQHRRYRDVLTRGGAKRF